MRVLLTIAFTYFIFNAFAQVKGILKDTRDGKTYNTIEIGNQVWMAENLNVDRFRNGDPIKEAKTEEEWKKANENKQPAWCYYNNDPANELIYGKLYNWYAVNDSRGLAPKNWKIPSVTDWRVLEKNVNNLYYSNLTFNTGSIIDQKLMGKELWKENENGTNETGFNVLPGGFHGGNGFQQIGEIAYFWSLGEPFEPVFMRRDSQQSAGIIQTGSCHDGFEGDGFAIRCLLSTPLELSEKEKTRVRKNKYFNDMVYIDTLRPHYFPNYILGKPLEKDTTYYYSSGQLKEDINPFYISDHEVSNGEYREFINWVRDSIARVKLFKRTVQTEKYNWGSYFDNGSNADLDGKMFKLNYETEINYNDNNIYRLLEDMYVNPDERYNKTKEIDIRILFFDYVDEEGMFNRINPYPDTMCWERDFPYDNMRSLSMHYFWNSAYYVYPVVGITYSQAKAYCFWRTKMYLSEMSKSKNKVQKGMRFRLPTEHEWMLTARSFDVESLRYNLDGFRKNQDGSYDSNFGLSILRSGINVKMYSDDGEMNTSKVKSYKTNSNGVYCIFGNVSEWVDEMPKEQNFFMEFIKTRSYYDFLSWGNKVNARNHIYITDPYSDSTYYVKKLSDEHNNIVRRRLEFFKVNANDSYETVKTKYYKLYSIQKEYEAKVNELISDSLKSFPTFCKLNGLKLYNFITGEFFFENCIYNSNEFDLLVYPLFEKFKHNENVIDRARKVIISNRTDPKEDCRLVKGGSWADEPHYLLIQNSQVFRTSESSSKVGFRVACDASEDYKTINDQKKINKTRKLLSKKYSVYSH